MILWIDSETGFQGKNGNLMQIKPWAWWTLIKSNGKHFSTKRYPWRDQHILLERRREVCSELYGLGLENLKLRSRRYSPVLMVGPMALGRQLQSFILFVMPEFTSWCLIPAPTCAVMLIQWTEFLSRCPYYAFWHCLFVCWLAGWLVFSTGFFCVALSVL